MALLGGAALLAAPTTQGPASRAGQGSGRSAQPQFTDHTNAWHANEVQWNFGLIGRSEKTDFSVVLIGDDAHSSI